MIPTDDFDALRYSGPDRLRFAVVISLRNGRVTLDQYRYRDEAFGVATMYPSATVYQRDDAKEWAPALTIGGV